jgi:hypothetical protein
VGGAFDNLFHDLKAYITAYGVAVPLKTMDVETPGEFDGLTIAINPRYRPESRSYYLAHRSAALFNGVQTSKRQKKSLTNCARQNHFHGSSLSASKSRKSCKNGPRGLPVVN